MNKPFFSIIVPTLNEEVNLPILLTLIQKQSFKDFEVIVVDGKSTDKTVSVAQKFKKKIPLRVITSDKRNLQYQRNKAAEQSRGKFLILFDADALIPQTFLEKVYTKAQRKDVHFVTTYIKSSETALLYQLWAIGNNIGVELSRLVGRPFSLGSNTIVSSVAFKKTGGYREDLYISDDHDFSIRVHSAGFPLHIVRNVRLVFSMRRMRNQGLFNVSTKYTIAFLYSVLFGPVTRKLYFYQMGGHVHKKRDTN